MPLIHSTSKKAFGENIARERAAGKPEAQSVAIAYATKREAAKKHHSRTHEHHSSHSSERSQHYHSHVAGDDVRPVTVMGMSTKAHKADHAPQSAEDFTEKGHKL